MGWRSSFEAKVRAAFWAAALVVATLALGVWLQARDADSATGDITRTHALLNQLARTRGYTLQIELATQTFRITGDERQLSERDEAISAREVALAAVRKLTEDKPEQQRRWLDLRDLVNQRLAMSRRIEQLRKTEGAAAANAYVSTLPLRETRARTYTLLDEMDQQERSALGQRESLLAHARQTAVASGAVLAALLLALLASTYMLMRQQLRDTEAAQDALARSEESLSTTLRCIGDAVLATDLQGCITRMNPVAEHLTGWREAAALGRPVDEVFRVVHETTREPAEIPVYAVLHDARPRYLADHTQLIPREGPEVPIADSAAPLMDAGGQLCGVVLVFRDVSAEREARRLMQQRNEQLSSDVALRTAALRESERHLHNVISAVPAMIAFVDPQRRYVYVNEQYRQRFAPEQPDITGRTVEEILGPQRYAIAEPLITRALAGERQGYDWQPFPGVWQNICYIPQHDPQGQVTGYYVLGTDISERKQAEDRIQALNTELEQRVRELEHVSRALRTLSAGNRTMLRASEESELLQGMCTAAVTAGGYGVASVWYRQEGSPHLEPMAEAGYPGGLAALRQIGLRWTDDEQGQGAIATAARTGEVRWVRDVQTDPRYAAWRTRIQGLRSALACPLRVRGEVIGVFSLHGTALDHFDPDEIERLTEFSEDLAFGIAMLRGRAEQERVNAAMDHLRRHDMLTGLPNALEFEAALNQAIRDAEAAAPRPFAVLQLDIERLGEINEALGYQRGDQILHDVATRVQAAMPPRAQVARLRGDEFAVLLPEADGETASHAVTTLHTALARPFPVADLSLDVNARTGMALFPDHGHSAHDLLRHADRAVNRARKLGLNHCLFDPAQSQQQHERLQLASELRRAIEQDQLRVYLQPKVSLASGRVCGAEALVRWEHPLRGMLPPALFIELAEHTGLIRALTQWMIRQTLHLLSQWRSAGLSVPIAVNLSARNLREEHFVHTVHEQYQHQGLPPGLLEFEITESTLMEDPESAHELLEGLRRNGFPLYIDDFGTGYSSLSYLQRLPVQSIKIDRSFVAGMDHDRDSAVIVASTIDLAHDLGRTVVAEGVETSAQWERLVALGCDTAQGYLCARPMPADAFPDWVAAYERMHPTR